MCPTDCPTARRVAKLAADFPAASETAKQEGPRSCAGPPRFPEYSAFGLGPGHHGAQDADNGHQDATAGSAAQHLAEDRHRIEPS